MTGRYRVAPMTAAGASAAYRRTIGERAGETCEIVAPTPVRDVVVVRFGDRATAWVAVRDLLAIG